MELARLRHQQTGLASRGIQPVSPPTMARYEKQSRSNLDLLERISSIESELLGLRSVKDSLDCVLNRMDDTDRSICMALFADGEKAEDLAEGFAYSRSQLYRRAAVAIDGALNRKH